jgi:hypothetical protein
VALHGSALFEAAPGAFHAFQVLASKRHADVAHLHSLDRVCVERFLRRQPFMIDRELVNRKLSQIVEYLTAVDINAHLIVELIGTPPQDYYDSFEAIEELAYPSTESRLIVG